MWSSAYSLSFWYRGSSRTEWYEVQKLVMSIIGHEVANKVLGSLVDCNHVTIRVYQFFLFHIKIVKLSTNIHLWNFSSKVSQAFRLDIFVKIDENSRRKNYSTHDQNGWQIGWQIAEVSEHWLCIFTWQSPLIHPSNHAAFGSIRCACFEIVWCRKKLVLIRRHGIDGLWCSLRTAPAAGSWGFYGS